MTNPVFGPGFGGLSPHDRLARTARELESIVVSQLFSSMRKSVPDSGLFEKSSADDMFRSMLDDELARVVSEKSPFGLARAVEKQLEKQVDAEAAAHPEAAEHAQATAHPQATAATPLPQPTPPSPASRWRA